MNSPPRPKSKNNLNVADAGRSSDSRTTPRILWPALLALGHGLSVNQATALELGDIDVQSALGQPLRASIAYALSPNETIRDHCIFLRPARTDNGLPSIRNATTSAANGVIRVTGSVPIREPMLNLQLMVDCPGSANLSRQYFVFVNPSSAARSTPVAATDTAAQASTQLPVASARVPAATDRAQTAAAAAIRGANSYRVRPGDTLSGIAARITDRSISLWAAVDVIFAANPQAFIDNDRNLLRAGAVLALPDMGTVADTPQPSSGGGARTPAPAADATAAGPDAAVREVSDETRPPAADATPPARETNAVAPAVTQRTATGMRPGDVSAGPDSPFVTPIDPAGQDQVPAQSSFEPARETIPPTRIDATRTTPIAVAAGDAPDYDAGGFSSLAWLGGAGVAIILGLLLFGRQFRDRFGASRNALPAGVTRNRRRGNADDATRIMPTPSPDAGSTPGAPVSVEPVTLDADLGTGTGFDDDGDIYVAQDFGFSTARDLHGSLDMEFSEAAAAEPVQDATNTIPPKRLTDTMIVEEEIPPSDETGEYDLSMIVDATRQPIGDTEDTTKDLKAVQVEANESPASGADDETLTREVDYKILEQDYEDELTATQALNVKLLEEAELAAQADRDAAAIAEDATSEYAPVSDDLTMQLPDGDDFERTAEMPVSQDDMAEEPDELDDSGLHAEVTTELPAADNDATVDIDIESATIDTKKLRAS